QRVPEEDHEVDAPLDDRGANLLVAAQWAAPEARHLQVELAAQQLAGRAGGEEQVPAQRAAVVVRPLEQFRLAVVVGNEDDALGRTHRGAAALHGRSAPGTWYMRRRRRAAARCGVIRSYTSVR